MINVTKIIRNAIIANNITDEVNVFNYTIDDHFHEKTDKPIIRIYPLPFNPDTYADDNEISREYHYQIDVWWSQDEPNEQAEKIVELLKVINFQCYYREPLYESDVMSFRHIIRAKGSILSMKLEEN
ncbi:hypothetical protein IDG72_11365 [Staphylococcus sp. EG-SA-29]|jgi:hypothetical protein|uniref:Uncharacterized protein n=3 Tax=root TaxID=1 RepID=A0A385ISB5_9CAUD|nr:MULTISPECIES: hypothetical protein [Staphylococcus]YP_009838522.1 tail terminator [Staphylococcus phage SA780ruMSSAST101]EGS90902.1 hypothetical protein SA21259_2578 [Staphylococcus aureus subsp. aureus 21259]EHS73586.1 hypothetical protein IS125_2961 [Staphylococcus aureus subsp. aureus IS-125]HDK9094367.1 hypothetical protein [Staphylococcus aureus CC80-24329]ACY10780.1 conserved hypothetical phage protein [Staphylococcus aureus subsp. aureus ED98]AEW65959.1 hypothetical protein MS7_1991